MPISGKDMLKLYLDNGWVVVRQKGSHVSVAKGSSKETIPMHRELKKGTEFALKKRLSNEI
jgi:predicted RNA binding protein YcfA (HicA-like mRNA interferase family)